LVAALLTTGLDTGWTFYTPYSIRTSTHVVFATFGAFVLGFSSIFTGINFLVTINTMRPRGMDWFHMPLFLWALYSTAIIQVLATPVLGITLLLLMAERFMGIGIFDPELGGDPVLFQHFFWFYSHPAVYIMILPAMGVISELISVYSQKRIFGYTFIAFSSVAIALLGFLVWGHHMFTSGQSVVMSMIFSAITFSVAIPSAVKVFNWLATLYKGSILLTTPMCYALSFIFLFGIGGLTGLFLGALATDIHLHDTYFVVAHFHYVMVGGTLTALFGGLFHWWPKMFGRMYNDFLGRVGCFLVFLGFNLTFFPQFVMGSRGMPRRYATYDLEYQVFHQWSTIGAFVLGIGIVVSFAVLVYAALYGRKVTGNPFGAASLEWQSSSPPSFHNFDHKPIINDPYDFESLVYDETLDSYVLREFMDPKQVPERQPVSH
jgi:cytochrome c oxidase subunit I